MQQKICNDMHWSAPVNQAFSPPQPPPAMHPPINPWRHPAPWFDPYGCGTCVPGVHSGLYNPLGPMILGNAFNVGSVLTNIETTAKFSLVVSFTYSDSTNNFSIEVKVGDKIALTYLENAQLCTCVGKVVDIWKVYSADDSSNYYKLKLDCSTENNSSTVIIKNDQIRGISTYVPHADEDTTLASSTHRYGTTTGKIVNATVTNAVLDANWNLIEGDIIAGTVEGYTLDGIASGTNSVGSEIMVINGKTYGGVISGGTILSGIVHGGQVNGTLKPDTNITENATVENAEIVCCVIINTTVTGGKTTDGTFFNAVMEDAIIHDATITGNDMVTTGGITEGNITIGGRTVGGTAEGGTAAGLIGDRHYTIEGGTITPKDDNSQLITSGGVVVGGTIVGGQQIGNTIVNAVVTGGVCTKGITTNAIVTSTGGTIIPTAMDPIPVTKIAYQNPNQEALYPDDLTKRYHKGLLIFGDKYNGEISTNLGNTSNITGE